MVDNYDSFTFNLVHYLQQLSSLEKPVEVIVKRNDQLSLLDVESINPSHIVISPGPCDPDKAGLSLAIVENFYKKIPIFRCVFRSSSYWSSIWWQSCQSKTGCAR